MINNTETWKIKVDDYTKAATTSLSNWYNKVEEISNKTGLDNIANSVEKVTIKSDELRDVILDEGGVVDAMRQELDAVSQLTQYYANFRDQLEETIRSYEELIS
jgi:methyl-accepting chemotaxis protein